MPLTLFAFASSRISGDRRYTASEREEALWPILGNRYPATASFLCTGGEAALRDFCDGMSACLSGPGDPAAARQAMLTELFYGGAITLGLRTELAQMSIRENRRLLRIARRFCRRSNAVATPPVEMSLAVQP